MKKNMKVWIAKDEDGKIFLYSEKPQRGRDVWIPNCYLLPTKEENLPQGVNPSWEDEKPIEVKLKIEKI